MKSSVLILLFIILCQINCLQQDQKILLCLDQSKCSDSKNCIVTYIECQTVCASYKTFEQLQPCYKVCFDIKQGSQKEESITQFLNCLQPGQQTAQNNNKQQQQKQQQQKQQQQQQQKIQPEVKTQTSPKSQTVNKEPIANSNTHSPQKPAQQLSPQEQKIQNLKKQIENNPKSHPGTTLEVLDCSELKKSKPKVYIRKGNQHPMVINYFDSRCDYVQMYLEERQKNGTDWFFKWVDYTKQMDWPAFLPGKQIVNHIPNLQYLLSDKDGIYKTLSNFDKKNIYNFTSHNFHFQTYLFDLKSDKFNPSESDFFNNVNDGYWLAKDPTGSLGLGIKLFRGTEVIKKNIQSIKSMPNIDKSSKEIQKFSVIQQYLHNPLLIDKKKYDLRVYILIASVDPFVLLYQPGFARKCIVDYDLTFEKFDTEQAFKHLTNRVYQAQHPDYEKHQEDLLITPMDYENILKTQLGLTQNDIDQMNQKAQRAIAYSVQAAKEKFELKRGMFQLLGVDIIFDDQRNPYLIEFNTSAGLFTLLQAHLNVVPQLVQTTLDLILKTHKKMSDIHQVWKNPEKLELGRWQILQNDATGYDILKPFISNQQQNIKTDL